MAKQLTWDDLGAILGYDSREFRRWRKEPGAPVGTDVEEWRRFFSARGVDQNKDAAISIDAPLPGDCDYDDLVRAGKITYALAKIREQVKCEQLANETKRVELSKARGALVTREEADRALDLVRDSLIQRHDRALMRALTNLGDRVPAELKPDIIAAVATELDAEG